ncbi:BZIP transcription factor family protein isoform 1 [Dorcoceras hygrometricum]|nr:BZIP transcription factor family protein isoform 1 [Dorcoceras hygrometricum]
MNSAATQFVPTRRMGLYEPMHQMDMWEDFKGNNCFDISPSMILDVDGNESEHTSHKMIEPSNKCDEESSRPVDKVLRRLAQNREAARKSRLRKKAYVQQLENSKQRLIQIEEEIERSRKQGVCIGRVSDTNLSRSCGSSSVAKFEMEYAEWVEEQNRQVSELRNGVNSGIGEVEMRSLVDIGMKHYFNLFKMKQRAAKADAFYLMCGAWKTCAERLLFFWIGGFRPSEFLKVVAPNLEPLEEKQRVDVCNLRQSCQQAEDALSQGMLKLHQIVSETIADVGCGDAMEKLEALVRFVGQADHLRGEALQQICRILTTPKAALAILALGEYFQRLRALSSLWGSRPYH